MWVSTQQTQCPDSFVYKTVLSARQLCICAKTAGRQGNTPRYFCIFIMSKVLSKKLILKFLAALGLSLTVLSVNAQVKFTAEEYIEKFAPIAVEEMKRTGIPASIKLGQGLLESSMGNSRLAREANNHFGIKCKKTWTGRTLLEDDDEKQECFRAYDSAETSYRDHSIFLLQNSRYAFLFDYGTQDYKSWATGLKKAGYATDPSYPEKLIAAIEKHNLHRFDAGVIPPKEIPMVKDPVVKEMPPSDPITQTSNEVIKFNKISAVRVHQGQTAASVAKEFGMRPWQIYKYNDLEEGSDLVPGTIIYLKPKKRKGSEAYHTVKEGETMYAISQLYGIKLHHLYRKNQMEAGQQPAPGEVMYLRKKRGNAPSLADTAQSKREIEVIMSEQPATIKKDQQVPDEKYKVSPVTPVDKNKIIAVQVDSVSTLKEQAESGKDDTTVYEEKPSDSTYLTRVEEKNPEYAVDKKTLDQVTTHTVKEGETLFSIAKQYGKSVEALKSLNKLDTYELQPGQQLIINENYTEPKPDIAHTSFYHEVQKGQTLYSIAKMYNLTVTELKDLNSLTNDQLNLGQKLYVYKAARHAQEKNTETLNYQYHEVRPGETLYAISKKYNIPVEELKKLNNLQNNDLAVGQRLRVK